MPPAVWLAGARHGVEQVSVLHVASDTPMGGTATVLVVEDDPSLRMLCRVNLELEGHHVLEAATIERAEELLRSQEVHVMLLDLHVGDRHGLELMPVVRREFPDVAVCLLSGTSETNPPREDGVRGFIRKPFDLDQLGQTVRALADGQAAGS